jgi:hypothetical protein
LSVVAEISFSGSEILSAESLLFFDWFWCYGEERMESLAGFNKALKTNIGEKEGIRTSLYPACNFSTPLYQPPRDLR